MTDFDLFNNEINEVNDKQTQLPEIIEVPQEEQQDKRKGVQHTVVFPAQETIPGENDDVFRLPPPYKLARLFPFQLDPFQLKAIAALERGENVLVSAHTSAGKTVVAEYAVALCLKRKQRIVYTSPIKALSNQKYRDWQEGAAGLLGKEEEGQQISTEIPTIGLLTGDTTINRDAQVLVMTTEVLRNMLQSSSELLRELGCVVFDEVHYMRNAERGVVWEDCISLLDKRVQLALLSATVPNAPEFASWIAQTRNKITHVVYTEYRPVPLGFYVAPLLARAQFQLFTSDNKTLNQENFTRAIQSLPMNQRNSDAQNGEKRVGGRGNKAQVQETIMNVLETLGTKGLSPVIVFSFGKLRCEELAGQCRKNQRLQPLFSSLTTRQAAMEIFDAALLQLPEQDRQIEQIQRSRELLANGIAVHHSGLLPFVKEVTELLFQEDLIKVIFVTETFAMGLNLPARAVVFSEFQKFDGEMQRWITSGEFIQMAGRAGRRGKDVQGIVVGVFSDTEQLEKIIDIMSGDAESLDSAYRLGFGAVLNFLSYQGLRPEDAVERSFRQFQRSFQLPKASVIMQSLRLQIKSLVNKFNAEVDGVKLVEGETEAENNKENEIYVDQIGNFLLLNTLHRLRTSLATSIDEFQEKAQTRGRIVKFDVYAKKNDAIPRVAYGTVVGSTRMGGGLYLDVLVPAAAPPPLSGNPSIQFARPPVTESKQKVLKLKSIFGYQLVDTLLPSFSFAQGTGEPTDVIENQSISNYDFTMGTDASVIGKSNENKNNSEDEITNPNLMEFLDQATNKSNNHIDNDQEDENAIMTDIGTFESNRFVGVVDEEFKFESLEILNGLIVELGQICGTSEYLKASNGAKQYIANLISKNTTTSMDQVEEKKENNKQEQNISKPFGGASPKIIRISVNQLTGISKSFLQQLPMSMDSADSRQEALNQFSIAIKRLAIMQIEEIVKKFPDLRGVGIINKLLFHADDALRIRVLYPNQAEAIDLINNNPISRYLTTSCILYQGMMKKTLSDSSFKTVGKLNQSKWENKIDYQLERFQQVFGYLSRIEAFRRYLSGRLNASSIVLGKELKAMEAVLVDMNYVDETRVVTQKGRFAAKLNAVHELILSECLFNASLQGINPVDLVTLVGLLLPERTLQLQQSYGTEVENLAQVVKEQAERVWIACEKRGAGNGTAPGTEPVNIVNGAIARQWASGDTLISLCKNFKGLFEGTAVRLLKRLVTALQQLGEAAELWAQSDLSTVVEEAIRRVNRGIVKADSLYIVHEQEEE